MEDEEIVRLLSTKDPRGLVALLERYGGLAKGVLAKCYGGRLDHLERAEALNEAAANAWRWPSAVTAQRGTLKAWFCQIAVNAARRILREKQRQPVGDVDPADERARSDQTTGPSDDGLLARLESCIARLPHLQREIVRADLAAGGDGVDARTLAARLETTINAVYVSRNKARHSLRECLARGGHEL